MLAFWLEWCEDLRFVDALKRETAERFLDLTHRRYHAALGDYFGRPITHVYTDDLYIYHPAAGEGLPYTERLPDRFAERLGYDFFDALPRLVENLPGSAKARLDGRGLLLERFLEEYVEPMHRWCEEHGVRLTGHLCGDEGPIDKAIVRLASPMAFYEYEHTPGVDDFLCSVPDGRYLDRLRNPQGHCPVILFKQASSVANQLKHGECGADWLDCGHVDGVLALRVNGVEVGCRYAAPYRFRLAGAVRPGANRITLVLHNTAQNLFGPHRRPGRDAFGACEPRGAGRDPYSLARFGIRGPVIVC